MSLEELASLVRSVPGFSAHGRSVRVLDHCVEVTWSPNNDMQSAILSWLFLHPRGGIVEIDDEDSARYWDSFEAWHDAILVTELMNTDEAV